MLNKNQRKTLMEQNLLSIINENSNLPQMWNRIKRKCETAIRDLRLIATKSPDDKLQEIFNEDTFKKLLLAIFTLDRSGPNSKLKFRSPDLQLASFFADFGIELCIEEIKKKNTDTPESSKPIIDQLTRTQAICREIGFKYKLDTIEEESKKNKSRFICIY